MAVCDTTYMAVCDTSRWGTARPAGVHVGVGPSRGDPAAHPVGAPVLRRGGVEIDYRRLLLPETDYRRQLLILLLLLLLHVPLLLLLQYYHCYYCSYYYYQSSSPRSST